MTIKQYRGVLNRLTGGMLYAVFVGAVLSYVGMLVLYINGIISREISPSAVTLLAIFPILICAVSDSVLTYCHPMFSAKDVRSILSPDKLIMSASVLPIGARDIAGSYIGMKRIFMLIYPTGSVLMAVYILTNPDCGIGGMIMYTVLAAVSMTATLMFNSFQSRNIKAKSKHIVLINISVILSYIAYVSDMFVNLCTAGYVSLGARIILSAVLVTISVIFVMLNERCNKRLMGACLSRSGERTVS